MIMLDHFIVYVSIVRLEFFRDDERNLIRFFEMTRTWRNDSSNSTGRLIKLDESDSSNLIQTLSSNLTKATHQTWYERSHQVWLDDFSSNLTNVISSNVMSCISSNLMRMTHQTWRKKRHFIKSNERVILSNFLKRKTISLLSDE